MIDLSKRLNSDREALQMILEDRLVDAIRKGEHNCKEVDFLFPVNEYVSFILVTVHPVTLFSYCN